MTQDEIIELARQALKQEPREDWNSTAWVFADETLEAFAKLVAEKEREACAKVCDDYDVAEDVNTCDTAEGIAIAIRRRQT